MMVACPVSSCDEGMKMSEHDELIKLETEIEMWGDFLVDRAYLIDEKTDIDALLPDWIDCLVVSIRDVGPTVSSAPYIRVLLDYWNREMRDEVRRVIEKGWTKDLVPDRWIPDYAEKGRDSLDEGWVANLMVEYKWRGELVEAMLDVMPETLPGS